MSATLRSPTDEMLQFQADILANVRDAVIVTDLSGKITYWNKGAKQILGFTAEEMIGQTPSNFSVDDSPEILQDNLKKIEQGEDFVGEWRARRKDGTLIWLDVQTTPLYDSKGEIIGFVGVSQDITEKRDLEKRKEDFISMASHEFKTPIATIKGYAQILKQINKDPKENYFLIKMEDQINRLTKLVDELLDVSKIQANKLELKKEKFKIDDLIRETVEDIKSLYDQYEIIVEGKIEKPVLADRYRISQVLTNLLSNAIKYSPRSKRVVIRSKTIGRKISVSVQDFGIGISKRNLGKIFDKFFQAENTIRQSFSGLGLGLYISNEIIRQHGGQIKVKSDKGKGSTFTFSLPIRS